MYNSKLYTILQHFDKYEQNRCRKYIQSPYFNRSEELIQLFELIIKHINKNSSKELDKQYLWKKIQGNKRYDDVRFRKYSSDLLKLVEGYLAQQMYDDGEITQITNLMEAITRKKIPELYQTAVRSAKRLTDKQPYRTANYYHGKYKIENSYYYLTAFETKRSERSNIEDISHNLDVFYLAEKLRILCAAITQKSFVKHDYEVLFTDEIIQHVRNSNFEEYPPVALYYQIYLTLTDNENEEHYFKLKMLLDKFGLLFPPDEAKDILYMAAQNYCIRKINKGNPKFIQELFSLYEDLIQKEILFSDGELSPWYFKNIVVIALRLGKYDWTENFIKTYSQMLPESFRDNAVTFNLARLYWYQKRHGEVIQLLREVEYEDVTYNLSSKAMLLATYYETDEIEPLYSLLESFRAYLNRHKDIPEQRRRNYKNLIKYTKKLTRILPGNKQELEKLKNEIDQSKEVADKKWLKEKIAELEG